MMTTGTTEAAMRITKQGAMAETKWTSGRWTVAGPRSQKRGGFPRVVTGEGGWDIAEATGETLSEAKANAHLLAAAPDLYGALDALLAICTDDGLATRRPNEVVGAFREARQALARARGEE